MAARARGYSQNHDWDSSRDDYNSSTYDPQYPDDNHSGGVQLDHCRLYITNIPKALNDEGLRAAFSKFGTLTEVHISKDPIKKYGLVRYETPGEAKLAMMKMNRTEPLKLNVSIAHKTKVSEVKRGNNKQDRPSMNGTRDRSSRDDVSVGSKGHHSRKQEVINGDEEMDDIPADDDFGFEDTMDPNLHLELEALKLEQLKIREEQLTCKQRMILLKQADRKPTSHSLLSSRCILPDGKIVVRNADRGSDSRDADVSYGAGAGDSHKIPGLQSMGSQLCVVCGRPAVAYCAGCGVTPYCGERCQRRDWPERHRAVCHNLARLSGERERDFPDTPNHVETTLTPAAPLRAPHANPTARRDIRHDEDSGSGSDRPKRNNYRGTTNTRNFSNKRPSEMRRPNLKQQDDFKDDEDWGSKGSNSTSPPEPDITPKPFEAFNKPPRQANPPVSKPKPDSPAKQPVKEAEPAKPAAPAVFPGKPPAKAPEPAKQLAAPVKPPASVGDVTPSRNLVPKQYLIETLNIGDSAVLSIDATGSECRFKPDSYICLSMSPQHEADYQLLCGEFGEACEASAAGYKPTPGETCAYLDPTDGGWYRGRCVNSTTLALLDASKLVTITSADRCVRLPSQYAAVPEFCCALRGAKTQVGDSVTCKLVSKTADGFQVTLHCMESGAVIAEAELCRWLPAIDFIPTSVPQVSRPGVSGNARVLLVQAAAADALCVRPADQAAQARYDDLLEQVALAGRKASVMRQPPAAGQTVLGMLADGLHYRALCRRTKQAQNKYQLEYIDLGNVAISPLEKIYECPPQFELSAAPTQVSRVKLNDTDVMFTPAATEYVELLKQDELLLSLPGGAKTAPSGATVTLTEVKNNTNVNKKIGDMCSPEWKKIEQRGGDVIETEPIMYSDVEFLTLPSDGCTLDILDASLLAHGILSGCQQGLKHAQYVFNQLSDKMAEYCNSEIGRQPYLPKPEEMCIAQCPPQSEWFRAVVMEQVSGAGGSEACVCYVDYGNTATVPVTLLRKMLRDFLTGLPVLASLLELADFPKNPTPEMVKRGVEYLRMRDGRGVLTVSSCTNIDEAGTYVVHAPGLIAAVLGN